MYNSQHPQTPLLIRGKYWTENKHNTFGCQYSTLIYKCGMRCLLISDRNLYGRRRLGSSLTLNSPISMGMGNCNCTVKTDPFYLISDLISVQCNFLLCDNIKYT